LTHHRARAGLSEAAGSIRKAFFFEKKQQTTFDHFGFGLSGYAQPGFALFFKKDRLSAMWPCLGVLTFRLAGQ
jgi:hypothetical protein